jgi:Tfp pilus assembly protein PilF
MTNDHCFHIHLFEIVSKAEVMFLSAANCPEVKSKAMVNLALVYIKQGESIAATGDLPKAKDTVVKAANYLDNAKVLLDQSILDNVMDAEEQRYVHQYKPLRLQCYRLIGSILFGQKDYNACENEFRKATEHFPDIQGGWEMLARVLELQGKSDEIASIRETINQLKQ